jgi:hypothetical protein
MNSQALPGRQLALLRRLQVARGKPSAGILHRVSCRDNFGFAALDAFEGPHIKATTRWR